MVPEVRVGSADLMTKDYFNSADRRVAKGPWQMRRLIIPLVLCFSFPLFARELNTITPHAMRDKVIERGVSEYHLGYEAGWATIDLLDTHHNLVSRVETRRDLDGAQLISVARGYESFLVVFDPAGKKVELRENDGLTYVIRFDQEAKLFVSDPGVHERFESHHDAIVLAIETIDDLRTQRDSIVVPSVGTSKLHATPLMMSQCSLGDCWQDYLLWNGTYWDMNSYWFWDASGGGIGGSTPACNGPWETGDSEASLTKSQACYNATGKANDKCSNGWCIGCCQLLACDSWCAYGDYLCFIASVTGKACGAPL